MTTLLITNDGQKFSVEQAFVDACSTLKMFKEDTDGPVPLPNIESTTLEVILKGRVPYFEDPREIFPLMQALDYLGHDAFLDDCAKSVAEAIKGLCPDEIRKIFGIENSAPIL